MRLFSTTMTLIVLLINGFWSFAQNTFTVYDTIYSANYDTIICNLQLTKANFLYEDELFVVRKTCTGEFGGTAYFEDKRTAKEYACAATCTYAVNRINNKYYVICNTPMLAGIRIIEIDDPRQMVEYHSPKTWDKEWHHRINSAGIHEVDFSVGTKIILDTFFIRLQHSFVYDNHIYQIANQNDTTFLFVLKDNKLETVDTLSGEKFNIIPDYIYQLSTNRWILLFETKTQKGIIEINNGNIYIRRFQKPDSKRG